MDPKELGSEVVGDGENSQHSRLVWIEQLSSSSAQEKNERLRKHQ